MCMFKPKEVVEGESNEGGAPFMMENEVGDDFEEVMTVEVTNELRMEEIEMHNHSVNAATNTVINEARNTEESEDQTPGTSDASTQAVYRTSIQTQTERRYEMTTQTEVQPLTGTRNQGQTRTRTETRNSRHQLFNQLRNHIRNELRNRLMRTRFRLERNAETGDVRIQARQLNAAGTQWTDTVPMTPRESAEFSAEIRAEFNAIPEREMNAFRNEFGPQITEFRDQVLSDLRNRLNEELGPEMRTELNDFITSLGNN